MRTRVIDRRDAPTNWHLDASYVDIGRGRSAKNDPANCRPGELGYLGNPFRLAEGEARGATIEQYRAYFYERIEHDAEFRRTVCGLLGRTLVCWCAPRPCHGDVIAAWLEAHREAIEFNAQDALHSGD